MRMGPSVKLAYVDQSRQSLNDKNTVWQEISGGLDMIKVGNYETPSRGYVGRFNFKGTGQQQNIGELSGGERNRVHLAKVLKSGGNVLMLDEPTNDLDVETLACPGRGPAGLSGLRSCHIARPLVPGSHRHPHSGFRRQLGSRMVRG
jgi:ATPase subunit of ABC transporter with duplicated ATPase domains